MRIIGIDLAITGEHKAVVMNERGRFLGPVSKLHTWSEELGNLLEQARQGTDENEEIAVIMEPTGLAWLPIAIYLIMHRVTVYLVNSQKVADLRRFYQKHAKSDRIDARVLAKLYLVAQEKLHPLCLPSADLLTLRRACKEVDWIITQITVLANQITAIDRTIWLGGWHELVFKDPFGTASRWCREHYYDPRGVVEAGAQGIRQEWQASQLDPEDTGEWSLTLVELAGKVLAVYGNPSPYIDFAAVQVEVMLKQSWLIRFETERDQLRKKLIRPLYHQLHPSGNLETLYGIGEDSAAVYISFIVDATRFQNGSSFRSWSGLIPRSSQSADTEAKGLKISQAGPDLIKKFAFLNANVARRYDPQLAHIYYDQMVHKGQHHTQAVCAVATHLLDRIRTVLLQDRPYQLRDVDGSPVSPEQARRIVADQYSVPEEVRQRNNHRARRQRSQNKAERHFARRAQRESLLDEQDIAF